MSNIFLIGPMGAGKSTIGKYLAKELKLNFFDTDRVIEERTGASVSWIFDVEGEKGFQKREEKILEELSSMSGIVLATGGKIVLSPVNRKFLASRGRVIYLKLDLSSQFERTKKDSRRPQLGQKAQLFETLADLDNLLGPLYADLADYTFDTNDFTIYNLAQSIAKAMKVS